MQNPSGPATGPDRSQDTFDFGQGTPRRARAFMEELLERSESVSRLSPERRRHLAIAMAAVGAMWIAPVVAGRHRRKSRRRRLA